MYLLAVFQRNPLAGVAVCLCLATIWWCIRVIRRRKSGVDRFLLALLGVGAVFQGLGILKNAGIWVGPQLLRQLNDVADVTVTALYLIAAMLLELSSRDRIQANMELRLKNAHAERQTGKPVLLLNEAGVIVDCDASVERALGLTREELLGQKPVFHGTPMLQAR